MISKLSGSSKRTSAGILPIFAGLMAYNQFYQSTRKQNECGGIMAYVSANDKGGLPFNKAFADFLRKQPYYQCGVAMNDMAS